MTNSDLSDTLKFMKEDADIGPWAGEGCELTVKITEKAMQNLIDAAENLELSYFEECQEPH